MTAIAQHAAPHPHPREDPHAVQILLCTAQFSDDAEVLDELARFAVTALVLRKIAHNPATTEHTLEHLIELDQRWLTFAVTRRRDLSPPSSNGSRAASPTAMRSSTPPRLRTPPRRPCVTWPLTRPHLRRPPRPSPSDSAPGRCRSRDRTPEALG
ncbi:hypothetical protein [Brachybacterium alimentarium]|uniref:hypothetical protein n=1 Tax=Brachybacterium alimentarium TaxID=47845 RepID=UPI003FD11131